MNVRIVPTEPYIPLMSILTITLTFDNISSMPYKNPDKQREYQRKWVANRRETFFRDKHCAKCGSTEDLELDHIHPSLKWKHRIWSYSWEKILKEVAKCQILCHSCHWEKSIQEKKEKKHTITHGFLRTYNEGCRCIRCRRAFRDSEKPYNERSPGTLDWARVYSSTKGPELLVEDPL